MGTRFPDPGRVRRLIPRFPSKLNFLPRRSIGHSTADSGEEGDSAPRTETETEPLLNRRSIATDIPDKLPQESQELPGAIPSQSRTGSVPDVFVGNIKLSMESSDTIADAFLNSSRKTLRFIPPSTQKDEIIIRPTPAMVAQGSRRWQSTAVGYFLGRRPYFPQLEAFARANWKGLQQVSATANGFFFFRFKTAAFMEEVIEEGPWLFQGQPVVLQPWEQGMSLRRQKHLQVPVWIRIRHLPMEYWTEEGLSAVASGIGTPLYTDRITKNCLRLDFARVCVMLNFNSKLPKHLIVLSPILSEEKEIPIKVDIEYEWLPLRCLHCCSLGHTANSCPETRTSKLRAPVAVYVQKRQSTGEGRSGEHDDEVANRSGQVEVTGDTCPTRQDDKIGGDVGNVSTTQRENITSSPQISKTTAASLKSKGKEIVVYNPFAALESDEADWVPSDDFRCAGPNVSSPAELPP
ncbi:UNVERIFIED_CONTAM: hypothetical protein Sradi_6894400 [Sesamum radiatum]|uniref:DUF4283 domain-containing protein n=1 Tax=Sesamum radiatum TaxID=300843 RepID=A0AAW2JKZ9_SESRA